MTNEEIEIVAIKARNDFIVYHLPYAFHGYKVINGKLYSISRSNKPQEIFMSEIARFINNAIEPGVKASTIMENIGADTYKLIVRKFIRGLIKN